LLAAPLLLMGCLMESQVCVDGNCTNASVNASLELPESNQSVFPTFNYGYSPLFNLYSDFDSVRLGESFKFKSRLDFGSDEPAYANVSALGGGATGSHEVENDGKPAEFEYLFAGKKVGEYEVSFAAQIYYANNSLYNSLQDSFRVTVKPVKYYHDEHENASIEKAAQSFAVAVPVRVSRIAVYGEGNPVIWLCRDLDGKPVESNCVTANATEKNGWHAIEVDAELGAGKQWIVVENFDWFTDLYGEYDSNALVSENGKWVPSSRNFFFEASN